VSIIFGQRDPSPHAVQADEIGKELQTRGLVREHARPFQIVAKSRRCDPRLRSVHAPDLKRDEFVNSWFCAWQRPPRVGTVDCVMCCGLHFSAVFHLSIVARGVVNFPWTQWTEADAILLEWEC
jgi:hypothetical protein